MIFYGWGKKRKILAYLGESRCEICNNDSVKQLIKIYSYISLFFIPIIFWGTRYYIVCNHCQNGNEISKVDAKQIIANGSL